MAEYRAYVIGEDGHIRNFRAFVCDGDVDAMVWAKQLLDDYDIELWSGDRFVIRFAHAGVRPPELADIRPAPRRRRQIYQPDCRIPDYQRTINWLPLLAPTVVYHRIRPQVLVTERVEAPACICAGADVAENHLLTLLDNATRSELKPHMRTIAVEHGEVLHGPSSEIEFVYFPQSTIVSVLARTEQGQTAETSIVGREGMIGSSTAL